MKIIVTLVENKIACAKSIFMRLDINSVESASESLITKSLGEMNFNVK